MENNGHQALFHNLSHVFGTIGTVLWTFQLLPQVYKNWRNESTKGLSPLTMLIWATACLFYAIYAVVFEISFVLIIQQMIFGVLCLICVMQYMYYDNSKFIRKKTKTGLLFFVICIMWAGFQSICVFGIRLANKKNIDWPKTVTGIIPTVLVFIGYVPQFYEIYRRKIVCGISLIFLAIDMLGAAFSALCLAFNPPPFDAYAASFYFAIFTLDLIIFILYYLFNWMHKKNCINNNNGIDNNLNNDEIVEIIIDDKV
ncbi:PQ loop repeat-domain-containing protein [Gigaspora rosea]|uniref:PQ loop repeat-domain-containing protein n=1 Tax=Gigaspora rosea TaxID=44941 RepID=A0A397VD10_9GLOM|nr:PQ loop repeat-domain-containing protein [Gigaspora rosea]